MAQAVNSKTLIPNPSISATLESMRIIGHRGARGLAPENTIASFLKAIEHGVDEIECDVRVTKDHIPVLTHDAHLTDASGNKVVIAQHTLTELLLHKADLTTLEAGLHAVKRSVPLVIEIKKNAELGPIFAVIQSYLNKGWTSGDILLASFQYPILQAAHKAFPNLTMVVNERWSGVRATARARHLGTKRLCMKQLWLWNGFIRGIARGGYELYPYTVNDPRKAARWAKAGIAGIVTDFPDRFQQ